LYEGGNFDVSREPMIVLTPQMEGSRYWSIQAADQYAAWFFMIGSICRWKLTGSIGPHSGSSFEAVAGYSRALVVEHDGWAEVLISGVTGLPPDLVTSTAAWRIARTCIS